MNSFKRGLRLVAEPLAILLVVAVTKTVLAEPFYVPSGSMQPTLMIGDELVATKYPYGFSRYSLPFGMELSGLSGRVMSRLPERGDVVVFRLPSDTKITYVKRVIGLPGDRVGRAAGPGWL
jgi:signal peptidase I